MKVKNTGDFKNIPDLDKFPAIESITAAEVSIFKPAAPFDENNVYGYPFAYCFNSVGGFIQNRCGNAKN
jgi:hypothetical protein